jgi:hypothetical protein
VIDYDFEERLVDRIAAREAIAARLSPRQKLVLRHYLCDETLDEIGRCDEVARTGQTGRPISRERIRQILIQSTNRLRAAFAEAPKLASAKPLQTTRNTPPPGFDKAAFLRHMQGLIAKREEEARKQRDFEEQLARNWRKREREALDRIMRNEELDGLFDPPPPKPVYHYALSPPRPPPPTADDLSRIAHRALEYLLLTRPQYFAGTPWLGKWCTSVVFPVEGGVTTVAVDKINAEIPSHARLSAFPVEIPKGTTGANATTPYASLRVTLTDGGLQIRFDVTWD